MATCFYCDDPLVGPLGTAKSGTRDHIITKRLLARAEGGKT